MIAAGPSMPLKCPLLGLPKPSPSFRPQLRASFWQNHPGPLALSTILSSGHVCPGSPRGNPAFAGQDWLSPLGWEPAAAASQLSVTGTHFLPEEGTRPKGPSPRQQPHCDHTAAS